MILFQQFVKSTGSVLKARLKEFYRDKASFYWNLFFPFFIIASFYFIFGEGRQAVFKVGVVSHSEDSREIKKSVPEDFFNLKYVTFLPYRKKEGLYKVNSHSLDMLIEAPSSYWINDSSKNGYLLEKILKGSHPYFQKKSFISKPVDYVDWVFPGVLALNVMFSCFWGVGWLIVKYRDEGYLKRLYATPLKSYQFVLGHLLARLVIASSTLSVVFLAGAYLISFEMQGSYLNLILCYLAGVLALTSIGLLVAARTTNKEFADGALNIFSWPMIIFSGVWFSMEGAEPWLSMFSYALPMTHLVESSRRVMIEGAGLLDIWPNLTALLLFSLISYALIISIFKWNEK